MNCFLKNTKRFSIIFTSLILAVTLTAGSFAAMTNGFEPPAAVEEAQIPDDNMDFADVYDDEMPESEELQVEEMSFNLPLEMIGVYLVPGEDFLKSTSDDAVTVKKQIDDAIEAVIKAKMNTVIIDTVYGEKVIYITKDSEPKFTDVDLAAYITEKCRENGLYVYAIFDASPYDTLEKLDANLSEFAEKHMLDGILLDGYEGKADTADYTEYIKSGSSMGYDNYKNQVAAGIVKTASKAIRKAAPDTQAGLLANPVWANAADNKNGSSTTAEYTSLISGFADTRTYIELDWFDFVAIKADKQASDTAAPFAEIASWWGKLADKNSIPLYFVYPSAKIGKDGWTGASIAEQISFALSESAYQGAIYDSLKNVPGSVADTAPTPTVTTPTDAASLIKPIPAAPAPTVKETSAPAPSNTTPQTDEELWVDSESDEEDYEEEGEDDTGYASSNGDLIKSISPMGIVTGEYGDDIEIKVVALKDSNVMATLNGETLHLYQDGGYNQNSKYAYFTGVYTVLDDDYDSDSGDGDLFLGALSVFASLGDRDEIFDGAYFATAKNSRYPVQITADQARTYPTSTRDCTPVPSMYPLPKGSIDYALGGTVTVRDDSGAKHTHLILESGVRVDTKDLKKVNNGPNKNTISRLGLSEKSGYTYIALSSEQKVTYSISYTGSEFIITFNNTTSIPQTKSLASNKMFSKATWSGKNKLVLTLKKTGSFAGFKGYYDGGSLVFRFNNPPSSIKNAKIYVDPGHGGKDTGAIGKSPTVYEKDVNLAIAKKLVSELKARGATVKMYNQNDNVRAPERVVEAEKWGADMIVSVHCNSSSNTSAKGTEVYYFYPFSQRLAINTSLNASKQFASDNRGAKASYYHVTLSTQMPSVLVETGFFTNKSDYSKLRKASYHQKLAVGIANGIEGAIKSAYTGTASNGTEFKSPGTSSSASDDDFDDLDSSSGSKLTSLAFSDEDVQIRIGESITLKTTHRPTSIKNPPLKWRTSNSSTLSVDDNGKITGNKAGFATITVTADDGSKQKATIRIEVLKEVLLAPTPTDTSGIALGAAQDPYIDEDFIMIYPGNKHRVEIFSDDGRLIRGKDFKWKSDDTKVATVDANGIVTGKAVGFAIITATGGGDTFECEIEVSRTTVAAKGISLSEKSLTMVRNTSKALVATITPKNATNQGITWSSSNSKIVEVTSNGVLIAKNAGKATITAKTKSGGHKATCNIAVLSKGIELEEIEVDMDSFEMRLGDTDTIYVQHYPSDTTSDLGLTFKSSNSSVVSVDSEGNVTALKKGTAKITVTSKANSKLTSACTIKVV